MENSLQQVLAALLAGATLTLGACSPVSPEAPVEEAATDDPSCTLETRDSACHIETHFESRPFSSDGFYAAKGTPIGSEPAGLVILCKRDDRGGWWVIADAQLVDGVVRGTRVSDMIGVVETVALPANEISALVMPVNLYVLGAKAPGIDSRHSCPHESYRNE